MTVPKLYSSQQDVTIHFGIGKVKVFFENAKFIAASPISPSNLGDQATYSVLAFIRLVGCAYFKKHANAFFSHTPSLMSSFATASVSPLEQHCKWLNHLRETIWDKITSENETIPSMNPSNITGWVLNMATSRDISHCTPFTGWQWLGRGRRNPQHRVGHTRKQTAGETEGAVIDEWMWVQVRV